MEIKNQRNDKEKWKDPPTHTHIYDKDPKICYKHLSNIRKKNYRLAKLRK